MMNKVIQIIFKTFLLSVLVAGQVNFSYAQTASILPNAKTTFLDNNGKPLVGGKVQFYIPGTTTAKTTWQDSGETIPNTNPVVLDGAGRAIILGDGSYRQVVKDRLGNLIWDQQTSSTGTSGGGTTPTVGDGDAVGTVKPWAGFTAPSAYVFSYGQELPRASFPELFAAITSQQNVGCTSGNATLTGLGDTSQIPIGAKIESICLNAGATVSSKTISTVVASSNAIISTTTSARFFPFGNGDGSATFNTPDLRGRVLAGRDNMGGVAASRLTSTYFGANASAIGATGGLESSTLVTGNLPPYTPTTASITQPVFTFQWGAAPHGTGGTPAIDNIANSVSGGTTETPVLQTPVAVTMNAQGGTSTPVRTVQPTETLNWIIKTIPDSNPNSFFGVASIGGMTGILTCGTGITCAGNNISAVSATVPPPSAVTLGGVFTKTCSTSNWFNTLDNTGTFGCSQPNFTDLAGSIAIGQIPNNLITYAKIQQVSANKLLGNSTGSTANVAEVAVGTGVLTALGNATNSAGGLVTSPVPYANLQAGVSDTVIGFWGSTVASALAIGNCSNALTYSTSTHTFGCNVSAGTGTVTTTGSPTNGQRAVFSGATSITGVTALAPKICDIISTAATTCNNGGSQANAGSYTSSSGALYTVFELVGGGSGGSGSGTSGNTTGGAGGNTTVNTTTTAPGAAAPVSTSVGGVGGAAGANCDFTVAGANGQSPDQTIATPPGAQGASSFLAGGGTPGIPGGLNGGTAPTNSGAGGGGGGPAAGVAAASAGGAGAYCRKVFAAGTYAYAIGASGTSGTAGTSGGSGGIGGGGRIIATDYFN